MFLLCAEKNQLRVRRKELLTSGSVNVCGPWSRWTRPASA